MNKHAYLIIAHNQFEILKLLLKKLDFKYHDFYILIDKKVDFPFSKFKNITKYSNIYWINRINISWGDYSQIQAEINLIKQALKKDYTFFHLLSGVDLPLKNAQDIYNFFEKNLDTEFIEIVQEPCSNFEDRYKYYYLLQKYSKNKIIYFLNKCIVKLQIIFKINRINSNYIYAKGANWFSISHKLANYIVEQEKQIQKNFKFGYCVDEIFLQTIILNSNYQFNVINNNLRFTIWDENHISSPKVLTLEDYHLVIKSKALFARKFDDYKSKELIKMLYEEGKYL